MPDFTNLPDLACRTMGGAVVAVNDESFCPADNLINRGDPSFKPKTFDQNGQIYDGWETRRRREPGHDWAIVRLGAPGVIRGVVVDTAFFIGNYPEACIIEAAWIDGHASDAAWKQLAGTMPLKGDTRNVIAISDPHRYTHVRLSILPDGGVARLRVHGEVAADPALLSLLPLDLAALTNGGRAVACSDAFFAEPNNMLLPGLASVTGDGWETRRRRDDGNDWAVVKLAAQGIPRLIEVDTSRFKFNAPGSVAVTGLTASGGEVPLLPRTPVLPDTVHRLPVAAGLPPVEQARIDIYPDGGLARLRIYGMLSEQGKAELIRRWSATAS